MSMHFAVMTKTTLWSFLPQVQSADFVCSECGKKYKTRGGYQRHRASKHNPNENDRQERTTLTPSSLAEIVKYAIQAVNRGRAFAPSLRNELNLYQFKQFDEGTDEFTVLKTIYDGYLKNGDIEKFYGKYYGQVPLQSTKFFSGLSHNAATLLTTKVADSMLVCCPWRLVVAAIIQPKLCYQRERRLVFNMWEVMYYIIYTSSRNALWARTPSLHEAGIWLPQLQNTLLSGSPRRSARKGTYGIWHSCCFHFLRYSKKFSRNLNLKPSGNQKC